MIGKLVGWVAKKAINKYIAGGIILLVLGSAGLMWHNFKQDLRDEGQLVCIQKVNEQTFLDLQVALADEQAAHARLRETALAAVRENELAKARLRESESKLASLSIAMNAQEKTDENYKKWRSTDLPDGVADRLRGLRTRSDPDTGN